MPQNLNLQETDKSFFRKLALPFFFVMLFVCACEDNANNTAHTAIISRLRIDETYADIVADLPNNTDTLIIYSQGGNTDAAYKTAQIIINKKYSIKVAEICLSACAEYLLPAATEIELIREPLIGYHRNPILLRYLADKNGVRNLEHCKMNRDKKLLKLLSDTGKTTAAWKETVKRLNLMSYRPIYRDKQCPQSVREFENKFWFPNSEQLETIFGLKVSGKLCADDPACYNRKIPHYFAKGGSFIVGDEKIVVPKRYVDKSKRIKLDDLEMPEINIED